MADCIYAFWLLIYHIRNNTNINTSNRYYCCFFNNNKIAISILVITGEIRYFRSVESSLRNELQLTIFFFLQISSLLFLIVFSDLHLLRSLPLYHILISFDFYFLCFLSFRSVARLSVRLCLSVTLSTYVYLSIFPSIILTFPVSLSKDLSCLFFIFLSLFLLY